jgi:hypothetical protein
MKRWMVRGRINKKAVKGANCYLEKKLEKYKDGEYLYYHRTTFAEAQGATMFKTEGSAKGKVTIVKGMQAKNNWYSYLTDIEMVEVKVVIPDDE